MSIARFLGMLLAVLCLLAAEPSQAGKRADAARARLSATMRTAHFVVHYDPSDPFLAKLMARAASEHLLRVSASLGHQVEKDQPFRLYVFPTHLGFIDAGGLETQRFTVGIASTDDSISVDASGVFAPASEVLAHEVTHAVIFRILGPNVARLPLWMNEGLAKYHSEEFTTEDDHLISDAAADGLLIPLASLASSFPQDRAGLAYAESSSAVRYMIEEYGKTAPRLLLREMARGRSFDQAMVEATGMTGDQFARAWYNHTTERYWMVRVTRIAMGAVSALMAVLAVAAFIVRRRQKIEAARRWEREEFEESLRRQLGNDWSQ